MCLLQAWHRSGLLAQKRVLVMEPAVKNSNDRTWCFWAQPNESIVRELGALMPGGWEHARTAQGPQSLAPYRYYHLRSADFYQHVRALLAACPQVDWLQAEVQSVVELPSHCQLQTTAGPFQALQVFDSRVPAGALNPNGLWQSFFGLRIRLSAPKFDPNCMELMNFEIDQQGSTQFLYVLPFNKKEALVELTRFDRQLLQDSEARVLLEDWVGQQFGGFEVLESEQGRIHMQQALNARQPHHRHGQRLIPIGTAAGAVKASTGYAFKQMWEHAEAITKSMQTNQALPTAYHRPRHAFYDGLLLEILTRDARKGKSIFTALFKKVPLPQVFRFLDEQSGLRQELPILAALPWPTFISALFRKILRSDVVVLLLMLLSVLLERHLPGLNHILLAILMGFGLLFPGIPHGAVDHLLAAKDRNLAFFVLQYLAIMGMVVLLWWQLPTWSLLAFLGYSAWHFGQTDAKLWQQPNSGWALAYGLLMLGFVLMSHPVETQYYLSALGSPTKVPPGWALPISLGLLLLSLALPKPSRGSYATTLLVLLAGTQLPLLAAFGFYFIGLHSRRGWRHLRAGLGMSNVSLFRQALPFSVAAWLLFVGLGWAAGRYNLSFEGWIPAFFVFLAAVSAPHVLMMHRFYGRK